MTVIRVYVVILLTSLKNNPKGGVVTVALKTDCTVIFEDKKNYKHLFCCYHHLLALAAVLR